MCVCCGVVRVCLFLINSSCVNLLCFGWSCVFLFVSGFGCLCLVLLVCVFWFCSCVLNSTCLVVVCAWCCLLVCLYEFVVDFEGVM